MTLEELLQKENINVELLKRGLKYIGLDLRKFDDISDHFHQSLTDLFRIAEGIDPHKTTKFTKLDVRSKLEKILKAEREGQKLEVEGRKDIKQPVQDKDRKKTVKSFEDLKTHEKPVSHITKLGKVKFFDLSKGFGYLSSFDDKKDCYCYVSKILTPPITENDIVLFESVESKKKVGELDAIKISNKIPVFIVNKDESFQSSAVILLENHLSTAIRLTQKLVTGFAIVTMIQRLSSWRVVTKEPENIPKYEAIYFAKNLLERYLSIISESRTEIEYLSTFLKENISIEEFKEFFIKSTDRIEQQSIAEIKEAIIALKEFEYFPEFVTQHSTSLNKISFVLWAQDIIQKLPMATGQDEVDIWRFQIITALNSSQLQKVLLSLLDEKANDHQILSTYKYLLETKIAISDEDEYNSVGDFLSGFKTYYPEENLTEENFNCSEIGFLIRLHENGILPVISDDLLKTHISTLENQDEKAKFIESLSGDKIPFLYSCFPELSAYYEKYCTTLIGHEFDSLQFICFDIESDRNKIDEYAWIDISGTKCDKDYLGFEDGLAELILQLNSGKLIIGHNIKKFDIPILAEHGSIDADHLIWDTFEIEMLLNPCRFSYALKTEHSATYDSLIALNLFKNQVSRFITSSASKVEWQFFLPLIALNFIGRIRNNPIWNRVDFDFFNEQSLNFFRPEPTFKSIHPQTLSAINEKIAFPSTLIISPSFLWSTLSRNVNLKILDSGSHFSLQLVKSKIDIVLKGNEFLKQVLSQYVLACDREGKPSYFHHLPTAIKLLIDEGQESLVCDNPSDNDLTSIPGNYCVIPQSTELIERFIKANPESPVIIIGQELYNLTNKTQLGHDIDFATLFDRLKHEPIWLQMSGGKNYIPIEKRQCSLLGISEFPLFIENIWMEKIGKGRFKIWYNTNFDAFINSTNCSHIHYIPWNEESLLKSNAFIVRPDIKKSGYIAEQKRVNPESLFRKLYWVYQFKIIEGLYLHSKSPKVLVVNEDAEIINLHSFARKTGYFVPDSNASLARQLELLHQHGSSLKLMVVPIREIDQIIYLNYIDCIDIIWDSFLLYEKFQMLKGLQEIVQSGVANPFIETIKEDVNAADRHFDLFQLIKEHQAIIDYYYNLLADNHPDSKLFLCDPRFADYYGIEKNLGTKTLSAVLWHKEKDYEEEKEIAAQFFKSVHINAEVDFDVTEAKEILKHIFLTSKDENVVHEWYDYQHPCLNDILPAKKDLLISLPTGAGKSLLFQGPSLFRSAFSCKLSIVISPLRALMQDQVDALWNKGFFSNVEFLSGDKSHFEIKDIYRRIAGGEIALLYITPERFRSRAFENALFTRLDADNGLEYVVFDEAHCISQWGQEFRPDYLNAGRKIADISNTSTFYLTKLLFSATISEQVYEEICTIMPGIQLVEGAEKNYNPIREHIAISFKHNIVDDERLNEVGEYLKSGGFNPELSRAIIFVKSRRKTEECALLMPDCLKETFGENCDFADKVGGFHAGMDAEDRKETYEKFKQGEIVILFSTKAFGMGMDIPNIHYIAHFSPPSTFEDFLQEIGRAGRNEEKRLIAGFNNAENKIRSICLTSSNDFAKLKDQLHQSSTSWHDVKEIKEAVEKYISNFKKLEPDTETPIAVPFNMYSLLKASVDDNLDNKFRLSLHWLERLERIKLGYFTITHLEFESEPIKSLKSKLDSIGDEDIKRVCTRLLSIINTSQLENLIIQISISALRSATKLSLEQLFATLIKAHRAGLVVMLQEIIIEPTKIRSIEIDYCRQKTRKNLKYPALHIVFSFAHEIFKTVPSNDSKTFDGEELDNKLNEIFTEYITFQQLPWSKRENPDSRTQECNNYIKDLRIKRSKHAFTVIRLLGKTKHDTKMEKVLDSNNKYLVSHTLFNGYHKPEEWKNNILQIEKDCCKILDYISNEFFDNNIKKFNLAQLIEDLSIRPNIQYLSDILFILSVLGYIRTGGMLPTGIEVYINSLDKINEADIQSLDKKIYHEFEQTRKLRELKLLALEVLSGVDNTNHDLFIKKYFACSSLESLIKLLEEELPANSSILKAFREEAIKEAEEGLKPEQRRVYDSEVNQHINVIAGPGSGKTHTLTLRVARLVHHIGIPPEEILVLAYNRAVVSELKERLSTLFGNLGYESLARRLKIFTFHGLAKKYCYEEVQGRSFDEWENILLYKLNNSPGTVMNQLGNIRHILVDEFQDINNVRVTLLNRLNELTKAYIFIIGDPNQSIYGYDRIKDNGSMSPWPYYSDFAKIFKPFIFSLLDNHRSYPDILSAASKLLTLPKEHTYLIPKPIRIPEDNYIKNYVEIIENTTNEPSAWPVRINQLLQERVNNKPYKQIAILFRTNNEVYQGFQRIQALNIQNIRVRIQGSLPYEFTRIRECHAVIQHLKPNSGNYLPKGFKDNIRTIINNLITQNPNWNHFYLRIIHALILDFFEDFDETMLYDNLIDYISEITYRDDGQLYKIYEKHRSKISPETNETEIVLTTMHKVKGLEFDVVIIPSSFSNLPLVTDFNNQYNSHIDQIEEEKRLMYVSYTRARFRLIAYLGPREIAMFKTQSYTLQENVNLNMGVPVKPEIGKLKIGWAAKEYNFISRKVNDYIKSSIKSGDIIVIKKRTVPNNGNPFVVNELFKTNSNVPIGELAGKTNIMGLHEELSGFVVNEVVAWSFQDTCDHDMEHGTTYERDWCQEARNAGYIYLVDFAGYGKGAS